MESVVHGRMYSSCTRLVARESFRRYGRYSQLHPGTSLRIVALNCFVQDVFNSYRWMNTTNIWGELDWLRDTLAAAEKHGEHVLIIGHMPPQHVFTMIGTISAILS